MSINTRGWDNIYVPEKVYIQPDPKPPYYEYSTDKPNHARIEDILNGFYASHNYLQLFYMLPEVFAPIHEIASRVSDAVWQLRSFKNDEVIYTDDNFNRLFSQPNPLNTIRQLVYQAVCFEIVVGKNFFYKNNPSTLPAQLSSIVNWWNLPANKVTADMKRDYDAYSATDISDFVERYHTPDNKGGKRIFDVKNVLPIINYSLTHPTDINCANSMLKGADKAIKNLIPVYEARGTIYIKRGALGFLVSQKSDADGRATLSPAERKRLRDDADQTYGLTGDKSTIGITDVPVDFVRTAMSISEMQPFEETLADAIAIYRVLRVPRHLVPSKDNSTFSNADADLKSFYTDVIIPWAKRYAELWTTWLGIDTKLNYKRYIYADFSHIDLLQENKKDKAATEQIIGNVALQRVMNGVWSLNNWLVSVGEEEINQPLYSKKTGEMTPQELELFKTIINLKQNGTTSQNTGAETQSGTNKL